MRGSPRRHVRRSSRSNLRKKYWSGHKFSASDLTIDGVDVVSSWARWPSGLRDPESDEVMAQDETYSRVILGGIVSLQINVVPAAHPVTVVYGLIAWDSIDPETFENVVTTGIAPNPAWAPFYDWIIRVPFTFTTTGQVEVIAAETFINSRAMRKLPPNTGVLACLGQQQPTEEGGGSTDVNFCFDVRHLLRQGYYSVS